ncbi:MAG: hypothetical protein M1526_05585 [Candidatus Thermoplasmatota archaeon]|jgi:hypothetical protein|nr:hypothetical protein [Candidatus Thermoplasmatota archaeon]MCL5681230.1 hypothetical protein [Candidatus Thermoplasmatota archaeon]
MTGMVKRIREKKVFDVTCPKCGEAFGVGFNPVIDGRFCHVIKSDGT